MMMMMPTMEEHLDSDRVNYLIWRYLQESNLRETAVKLQNEWQVEEPQRLDFAPHVKQHALVSILQKGLLYHEYERSLNTAPLPPVPSLFGSVTGPRSAVSPVPEALAEGEEEETAPENGRKRSIDSTNQQQPQPQQQQQQNGSPVKKARLSNGYENGLSSAAEDVSPMEIDQNGDGHAYPSPKEADEPVTPILTKGPDEATQFDKVTELIAETTYIDLSLGQQSNNTTLLHCAWSPRDPQILATAGTDALGLLWNMARGASSTTEAGSGTHVNGATLPPHVSLIDENEPKDSKIDALSWSHDGSSIALAIGRSQDAAIRICKDNGLHIATFNGQTQPIYCLRANPNNKDILVALMPDDKGTGITVSSSSLSAFTSYVIEHAEGDDILDAAWTGDTEFVVCGGDKLQIFSCVEGKIVAGKKFETRDGHGLEKVIYDKHLQLLATASSDGSVDIWTTEGICRTIEAHKGPIKALEWQPLPNTVEKLETERLLISAGHDGTVGMWNVFPNGFINPRRVLNLNASAVAAAFTPDGVFLAGATEKVILIWKVDDPSLPRATWTRRSDEDPQSPSISEDGALEDHYCLCWDMNGQKLAFGANNQLAVINFRR